MKVVLDTNVLVSGILFTGPPHQILLAWSEGRFELVLTSDIHDEYRRVAAELLSVSGSRGIEVLRPRAFVERYLAP